MKPPKIFNPLDVFIENFRTATEGLNVLVKLIIAIFCYPFCDIWGYPGGYGLMFVHGLSQNLIIFISTFSADKPK